MSARLFAHAACLCSFFAVSPLLAATAADLPPPRGCDVIAAGAPARAATTVQTAVFPPPQLDMRTPLEPTVLAGTGRNYLLYELHLHNFSDEAMTLRGLEVLAGSEPQALLALTAAQLRQRVRVAGAGSEEGPAQLAGGQGAVVYLCLAFDASAAVPATLRHRLLLDGALADGPPIGTRHTPLAVLGRPLQGTGWTADNGPSIDSHHRMGVFVAGGMAQLARRYALDWKKYRDGSMFAGDARDVRSYHAYGENVLAVADGEIVQARDGMPDNIPRTPAGFTPAVPISMENVAGNVVTIALGNGQFAQYAHLQPGSVQVKTGQRVRRGQLLGRVGNSGDARVPHLHFQVASKPDILASEGLPFLFDQYRLKVAENAWEARAREYPIGDGVIDFGTP